MGNSLILNGADFSNNNIGQSIVRKINVAADHLHTIINEDYPSDTTLSPYVTSSDPTNWKYDCNCSSLIELPALDQDAAIYAIIPTLLSTTHYDTLIETGTVSISASNPEQYIMFHNTDTNTWRRKGSINKLIELYDVKENAYTGGGITYNIVLAKLQLTNIVTTVDEIYVQWVANRGKAAGIGLDKPIMYIG